MMIKNATGLIYLFVLLSCHLSTAILPQQFNDVSQYLPSMPYELALGLSAVDINNDGWIDFYNPASNLNGNLYLNAGGNAFIDYRTQANFNDTPDGSDWLVTWGGVFGDYNNDGYLDCVLIGPNRLLLSSGGRYYVETTGDLGTPIVALSQGPGWADFNNDGYLDLYINDDTGRNQLYKNLGNGNFQDISAASGVFAIGNSYGMSWGDYNNDGLQDFFIATCSGFPENSIKHLLHNNGDETFSDVAAAAGVADSLASWGVVWLDYNNDGWMDIAVANTAHLPAQPGFEKLYRNMGDGTFTDVTQSAGITSDIESFTIGVNAADFDNDGWIDLYFCGRDNHFLFRNNGDETFSDVTTAWNLPNNRTNVATVADFNNDGWIDIYRPGELLYNNGGANNWIKISTRGIQANYYAVGARVAVYSAGVRQIRDIRAGESFCSQSSNLIAHFGLGQATSVDSITVQWPGGGVDRLTNVAANRHLTIVEGVGRNDSPPPPELVSPADGRRFGWPTSVRLSWQPPIDREGDGLTYRVYLRNSSMDRVFENITDTTFTIAAENFNTEGDYRWWVDVSDGFSVTGSPTERHFELDRTVDIDPDGNFPASFSLSQNFPNPFNPETQIRYQISDIRFVNLTVYDVQGRKMRTLVNENKPAGNYVVKWDGRDDAGQAVSSGVYYYRLQAGDFEQTRKMLLVR